MKTALSHILPVNEACEILGEPIVHRIVESLVAYKRRISSSNNATLSNNNLVPELISALQQSNNSTKQSTSTSNNNDNPARALFTRVLALDQTALIALVVPSHAQPFPGPFGHRGLYDCWVYALQQSQTVSNASTNPLILIQDVIIFMAVCKQYHDYIATRKSSKAVAAKSKEQKVEKGGADDTRDSSTDDTKESSPDDTKESSSDDVKDGSDDDAKDNSNDDTKESSNDDSKDSSSNEIDKNDKDTDEDSKKHHEHVIWTMAQLSFTLYDAYQKRGILIRDTIHRFLTDVYDEDAYKENEDLLDVIFDESSHHAPGWLQASVAQLPYCRRILDTMGYSSSSSMNNKDNKDDGSASTTSTTNSVNVNNKGHLLLDWLAVLGVRMIPLPEMPLSVAAFLDALHPKQQLLQQQLPVTERYSLPEERLFEVKRRFYALVQSSAAPIYSGDMFAEDSYTNDNSDHNNGGNSMNNANIPKQVIRWSAWYEAVSCPNNDYGHGGYLPKGLAELVFLSLNPHQQYENNDSHTYNGNHNRHGEDCKDSHAGDKQSTVINTAYWSLNEVLQFSCMAVRLPKEAALQSSSLDGALIRWLYSSVFMAAVPDFDGDTWQRVHVQQMLLLLADHAHFRMQADAPIKPEGMDSGDDVEQPVRRVGNEISVSSEIAQILGILPPDYKNERISLDELTDYAMQDVAEEGEMTLTEFVKWNTNVHDKGPPRLAPLIMDLRLMASVLFGIPPTLALMEDHMFNDIDRRHKCRYPQTPTSRRGPRGTVWYLIDNEWFKRWMQHIKSLSGASFEEAVKASYPGRGLPRINNACLLAENGSLALRPELRWKEHYQILPPMAWYAVQAWYDGGPPIFRTVVKYLQGPNHPSPHSAQSRIPTENEIELYPFFVTVYLCDSASRGEARPFQQNLQLSHGTPVGITLVQLCKELDVDPDWARLWVLGNSNASDGHVDAASTTEDWILQLDSNIVDQRRRRNLHQHDRGSPMKLLLEIKDKETGLWPRGTDGKEWTFKRKGLAEQHEVSDLGDGVVGLYNMGNTCYLNSSIQCLSHTPIFREYFTTNAYLNDINTTNPLGHKGQLAQVSAVLINSLWKRFNTSTPHPAPKKIAAPGSYVVVNAPSLTPKTFKDSLGKFNELFQGNEQHDAQELLAFLLGGLSEDLNRIVDKPYIEAPDSDGRPDSELADIWWSNHLEREMSIIVALFTGQYKSLLTCKICKYESARFEPFSFLQLPLPEDDQFTVTIILYPVADGQPVYKYCVRVAADCNIGDTLIALAKLLYIDEEGGVSNVAIDGAEFAEKCKQRSFDFAVVNMRDGYLSQIVPNSRTLQELQNKDSGELPTLHVYELANFNPNKDKTSQSADQKSTNLTTEKDDSIDNTDAHDADDTTATAEAEAEAESSSVVNTSESSNDNGDNKLSYLALAQRRSDLVAREFFHPLAHRVFGIPLLLRVKDLDKMTGSDLYDLVARRLRNFVSLSTLRFLDHHRSVANAKRVGDKSSTTMPSNGSNVRDSTKHFAGKPTTTDMEEVSAGPVPRYGFRLRATSRDGRRCLICPWYECCVGCYIEDNDELLTLFEGDSLAVDWHLAVDAATKGFGSRSSFSSASSVQTMSRQRSFGVTIRNHHSVGRGTFQNAIQKGAITLEDCLDEFAKEEKIPEAYCSRCKDFRVQTKQLKLWRLPPVMIIHLKRFQFTQHMRRKLRDLVVFPLEGLDLSRIRASDDKTSTKDRSDTTAKKMADGSADKDDTTQVTDSDDETHTSNGDRNGGKESHSNNDDKHTKDSGRSEMLYDLYGVVHHQGALSGGHYVASLKSEIDGQWRLFNDAQVYEIHPREVIDASAYILFYIRRDVAKAQLSDFWNIRRQSNLSQADMNQLMKNRSDRCVIS